VVKEINQPRLPSLKGKMAARKAAIPTWTAVDLGADKEKLGLNGSPTKVVRIFSPKPRGGGEILKGEPPATVPVLAEKIKDIILGARP
jgi:electron transfer flavoprotein beta subunit